MSNDAASQVGLCCDCRFARVQRSERGSEFWRCQLADTDERFLRYPPLPVASCEGHAPGDARDPERDQDSPG